MNQQCQELFQLEIKVGIQNWRVLRSFLFWCKSRGIMVESTEGKGWISRAFVVVGDFESLTLIAETIEEASGIVCLIMLDDSTHAELVALIDKIAKIGVIKPAI